MNWKHALGITGLVVLTIPLVVATIALLQSSGNQPEASCGNRLMEQDETPQNCCEDTGCLPSQSCTNHSCINIGCGYCEYAANSTCHRYGCCSDSECEKNETCSSNTNKCAQIECECGYIKNRTCVEYECCNGWECPSGLCSNNKCVVEGQKKDTAAQEEGSGVRRSSGSGSSPQEQPSSQPQPQAQQQPQQTSQPPQTCTPNPEVCDGNDNDCDSQIDEGELCPGSQSCIYGSCKTVDTSYKVQPVIFYPTDYANDQEMTDYLKGKFEEIRQFYLTKAGATFTMLQPQVVSGDHSHEWYWCVDNQQGCVKNNFEASLIDELKAKGFPLHPDWNQFPANRVTWVAAFGGGGYAGGRYYPTGGGLAIVGDAGIYAAKDGNCNRVLDKYFTTDNTPNVKASCKNSWVPSGKAYGFGIGALGHELGHALNLPHPDGYPGTTAADWEKTLIGYHWNYPNTGLLEQDKARLAQSPFINTKS